MVQQVVDVGGGTGFCTLGIVKTIPAHNVTLIDQSPHQLEKAKKKADLQGVTIKEVPAEHTLCCLLSMNASAISDTLSTSYLRPSRSGITPDERTLTRP